MKVTCPHCDYVDNIKVIVTEDSNQRLLDCSKCGKSFVAKWNITVDVKFLKVEG